MYVYGLDNRDFPFDDLTDLLETCFNKRDNDDFLSVFKAEMDEGVIIKHLGAMSIKIETMQGGRYKSFEYRSLGNVQ